MNYRQAELLATKSIMTAGVEPIDINVKDVISRISVVLELVNTNVDPVNHPLAAIKSIDIIDGSDVVASMTGYAIQALSYFTTGKMPHNELNYEDNAYCRSFVPLDFGRFLYDPELGLDPKKFKNLQMRIDHNYALGACTPDAATIRVLADMFDEKAATPRGYLQSKEIYSYNPAIGIPEYISLPLDNDIRLILAMNTNNSEEPDILFDSVKIDEEDGKRVVVDCKTMDLIRAASTKFGRFSEYLSMHGAATTDKTLYLTACKDIMLPGTVDATTGAIMHTWSGGRARLVQTSAAGYLNMEASGRCPHGAVPIFFGNLADMGDWWKMTNIGKARIILTGGAINATEITTPTGSNDVIVQSLQKY